MIAQFTLTPLGGKGDSLSGVLAKAMKHVTQSGLKYKVGPMSTVIEGNWEEVMDLINLCRETLRKTVPRVSITITVDDREGAKDPITKKVLSLERKMGIKIYK